MKTLKFWAANKKFFIPITVLCLLAVGFFASAGVAFANHTCTDPLYPIAVHESSGASVCKAADNPAAGGGGITAFISQLVSIMNLIVPFLIGLAVFLIIWGILGYISHAADEEKRQEAKDFIMWGVIGVFLMLSVWGLISILVNTFNLDNSNTIATERYGGLQNTLTTTAPKNIPELIVKVNAVGAYIIPFLIGLGVFIVIFGIFNYIRQGDNEEKRTEARMFIIWGIVSIFIMLSVWGFVNILVNTLKLDNSIPASATTQLPCIRPDGQPGKFGANDACA